MRAADPDCGRCVHYRVSWDPAAPRACALFGFKSKKKPSAVVFESSGRRCDQFRARGTVRADDD